MAKYPKHGEKRRSPEGLDERDYAMRGELVCIPCLSGEHAACRHRPDGPRFGKAPEDAACACEACDHKLGDGTCSDWRMHDYDAWRCGKPAKGTFVVAARFRSEGASDEIEVERCGAHLNGLRRKAANAERRAAERAEYQAERQRERENAQSAEDWARRLRDEHGIDATAVDEYVTVHAENLHAYLVRVEGVLRDLGLDAATIREESF